MLDRKTHVEMSVLPIWSIDSGKILPNPKKKKKSEYIHVHLCVKKDSKANTIERKMPRVAIIFLRYKTRSLTFLFFKTNTKITVNKTGCCWTKVDKRLTEPNKKSEKNLLTPQTRTADL